MSEVTRILEAIGGGDSRALERLLPLVYDELQRILIDRARSRGRQKRGGRARRLERNELDLASPPR